MKSLFRLIVLGLLLTGWGLAAGSLYVIRTADGNWPLVLLPRAHMAHSIHDLQETYLDTRNWTMKDVAEHPAVVARLIQAGDADCLQHLAKPGVHQSLAAQLAAALQQASQTPQASDTTGPVALEASPALVRLAKAAQNRTRWRP